MLIGRGRVYFYYALAGAAVKLRIDTSNTNHQGEADAGENDTRDGILPVVLALWLSFRMM